MSTSIVPLLVKKDFRLMRPFILSFSLVSLVSIGIVFLLHGRIPDWVLMNIGFLLLIGPAATCGIVLLIKTNVFEKEKSTQAFIMSLPVTVKEFTRAKLLFNLPVFGVFWLVISAVAFYLAFGLGLFPQGAVPFITMVFLGVFVAYTCILSTSLLFQSLGVTVLSILIFELGTSAYLWTIAFLDPISRHVYGQAMVWNSTAIAIVAIQVTVAVSMVLTTLHVQNTKRDFI
ncbi:hypothetical protein [Duganella sp. LjRoot269]|jgi:hypothetical protein|uniref:hypothetical protein n=1 Tax=Duganella sp. LjRoot269 TaxID=3342305 RepID=UPI00334DDCCF